jgi:hypothetical protein
MKVRILVIFQPHGCNGKVLLDDPIPNLLVYRIVAPDKNNKKQQN